MTADPGMSPIEAFLKRDQIGCRPQEVAMAWSFPVGRIRGIQIRVHITLLMLFWWLATVHYAQGGWPASGSGMGFLFLLLVCVVAHEFGHALLARRFGASVVDVTLLPIGAIARMHRLPETAGRE